MLRTGTTIDDRYEIVSSLGRGGFGAVYKAKQLQFDRLVAIKILDGDELQSPEGLARFEREAKAINALRHKNIVSLYSFGTWQRAPYMVMELIEGTALNDLLASAGKLAPARALNIIKQVFEGLASAHAAGVVHRDLKPANIMVLGAGTQNEQVKIIDFGLAKLMPGYGVPGQKLTETGYALGTCYYMAPEQAVGGQVDERADIYAAGCIFYELLAGRRPFEADDNVAVMFQHLHNTPPPLSGNLAPVVSNCMSKDRNARYQKCDEVLADLNSIENVGTIHLAPHMVPPLNARSGPMPSKRVLLATTSALVTAAAIFFFFTSRNNWNDSIIKDPCETSAILYRAFDRNHNVTYDFNSADTVKRILELDRKDNLLNDPARFACYVRLAGICAYHEGYKPQTKQDAMNLHYAGERYLLQASELYPAVEGRLTDSWALFNALRYADLLQRYQRTDNAIDIYKSRLAKGLFDVDVETDVRMKLAQCLILRRRYREAIDCLHDLDRFSGIDESVQPKTLANCYCLLGDAYCLQGEFDKALATYAQALKYSHPAAQHASQVHLGITYVLLHDKEPKAAWTESLKGIASAKHLDQERAGQPPNMRYRSLSGQLLAAASAAELKRDADVRQLLQQIMEKPGIFHEDLLKPRGQMQCDFASSELEKSGYEKEVKAARNLIESNQDYLTQNADY